MPIQNQNSSSITVNAVAVPQIIISTRVGADGKLATSARIVLQGAQCDNAGQANEHWTLAGPVKDVILPDVSNLAGNASTADLASLQTQLTAAFGGVVTLIGAINGVRKLV